MEETKENGRQYLNEWLKENGMKPLQDGLIEPWKSEEEQEWSGLRREKVEQAFSASAQKLSDGTKRSPAEKYGASPERKEAQNKSIPYIKLVKG